MAKVYTFGTFRFIVWPDNRVEIQTLEGDYGWKYAVSGSNPGFATFLRERAEIDYA